MLFFWNTIVTFFFFCHTYKNWKGVEKTAPILSEVLLSDSFLFQEVKDDFEEIKFAWENPGAVALYVVMGRRGEGGCEGPAHPASCLRPCPGILGQRKHHFHFSLLGLLTPRGNKDNKQEERQAQPVGEDG